MREGVTEEMGVHAPTMYYEEETEVGLGPFGRNLSAYSTFHWWPEGGKVEVRLYEGGQLLTGTSRKTEWLEEEQFQSVAAELTKNAQEKFWANLEEEME